MKISKKKLQAYIDRKRETYANALKFFEPVDNGGAETQRVIARIEGMIESLDWLAEDFGIKED